jgi:hypothetical protein
MSFIQLSSNDFILSNRKDKQLNGTPDDKLLCLKNPIPILFLMMYSNKCKVCDKVFEFLKHFPSKFQGSCEFGLVNIDNNMSLVQMSQGSKSMAIQYVPNIILFLYGRPYMKYEGKRDEQNMRSFLIEHLKTIQKFNMNRSDNKNNGNNSGNNNGNGNGNNNQEITNVDYQIPEFSTGIPFNVVCDEENGNCYLKYDEAYAQPIK